MSETVVTRIAPSPTGLMHIGTARTALFNWLYARGRAGRFLLRIEDTDRTRSTPEATQAILEGMRWLGLDWDGEPVSQFARRTRHAEVAEAMLSKGAAYKCFSTQEEIEAFRAKAKAEGGSTLFRSPWRDRDPAAHPDAPFVVRVKAPREGQTVIEDAVQGHVTIQNSELDDMIVLRSDGTATYMLAVVVDDFDMGVTHVIRGDDHLNNAARQMLIYDGMGWPQPIYAHIPLIHGEDGKKLSKRHGALGIMEWAADGFPAPAMRNYLARLGWSHGDDEFFTDTEAREWFDITNLKKSPARLDRKKLEKLSGQHIAAMADGDIVAGVGEYFAAAGKPALSDGATRALKRAVPYLKSSAKTFPEIIDKSHFVMISRPLERDQKSEDVLTPVSRGILTQLTPHLQNASWSRDALEAALGEFAKTAGMKFGTLAAPLRAALAGRATSPSVYDMMLVLGREETLARIGDVAG